MNKLNICYTVDQYNPPHIEMMGISIVSLIKNKNSYTQLNIFIIHNGISKLYQQKIQSMVTKDCTITFQDISNQFIDLPNKFNYYPQAVIFRLLIPTIFPQLERMIYIDCDTLIKKDLTELYNLQLHDNYIGALKYPLEAPSCMTPTYVKYLGKNYHNSTYYTKILNLPLEYFEKGNYTYANGGVLLFNIKKINEDHLDVVLIENIKKYQESLILPDEEISLKTFGVKIQNIHKKYNSIMHNIKKDDYKNAVIAHHAGSHKPIEYKNWYRLSYFGDYVKYMQSSPFARNKYFVTIWYLTSKIRWYIVFMEYFIKSKLKK